MTTAGIFRGQLPATQEESSSRGFVGASAGASELRRPAWRAHRAGAGAPPSLQGFMFVFLGFYLEKSASLVRENPQLLL